MPLDKPGNYIEPEETLNWIDKTQFLNKTQNFEIVDVHSLDKDIVLELTISGIIGDEMYMRINRAIKNKLIELFGNNPHNWKGNNIDIVFTEFKAREGSNVSNGVHTKIKD